MGVEDRHRERGAKEGIARSLASLVSPSQSNFFHFHAVFGKNLVIWKILDLPLEGHRRDMNSKAGIQLALDHFPMAT